MGDKAISGFVGILTAVVGLAIIAVLVSNQAQTSGVIGAAGTAFSGILKAAVAPVSGGSSAMNGAFGSLGSALPGSSGYTF